MSDFRLVRRSRYRRLWNHYFILRRCGVSLYESVRGAFILGWN